MSDTRFVSIITPCYNSENYLKRYLGNILSQTYPYVELIIVNDGSIDKTEEIALSYVEKFEQKKYRLIYVKQENKGLGGAINTGLKYVKGQYFTWCDSDNYYEDNYIEKKVDFFEKHPGYSIVRCDGFIVKDTDIRKPIATMAEGNTDKFQERMFEYCLNQRNFHFGCAMLKTDDFDKVNPNREIYPSREGQNWQLLLPMFYHYKSGYIDEQLFYFVIRENSISHSAKTYEARITQIEEYRTILLKTVGGMDIPDKEYYLKMVHDRFAHRILGWAIAHRDFIRIKQTSKYLKKRKILTKEEKKDIRKSHFSMEYLLYIKHRLLG